MPYYETVVVVDPLGPEGAAETHLAKVKEHVETQGGHVLKVEEWGKRKLAYAINHRREGIYFLVEFEGSGETVTVLERYYRVQESILRYLTINREAPSPDGSLSPIALEQGPEESIDEGGESEGGPDETGTDESDEEEESDAENTSEEDA